jgi:uncharacterized protein YqhQ
MAKLDLSAFYYGGQAVMEGVMMRGRQAVAVAVRRPEGDIYLYEEKLASRIYQNKLFRLPFFRGVILLWDMLILGTRMMTLSTNIALGTVDPSISSVDSTIDTESVAVAGGQSEQVIVADGNGQSTQRVGAPLVLTMIISIGLVVAIFFVGPLAVTGLLHNVIGTGWLSLVVEGVIRLALLVAYLYLIGRVPDIQRVFGYHGAEHKAINAMEHGDPLDVAHVRQASRVHTRCGTGFLLLVMVVSIIVFAFIGSPAFLVKLLSRIILVPVVAGIAYELMRLGAANYRFRIVRWLLAPGLALQGLTTREPDDGMIECAIASLKQVMARDAEIQTGMPDEQASPSPLLSNV